MPHCLILPGATLFQESLSMKEIGRGACVPATLLGTIEQAKMN